MATFAFSEDDRQRWAEEGATAVAALALALRARMAANLTGKLPAEASSVFQASWWQAGIDGPITDEYERIAAEAAETFHEGAGLGKIPDALRDLVASAAAAAIVGVMGGRGPIVEDRVAQLLAEAAGTERTGEQLAAELGLDGTGGPLSEKLMDDIGRANSNGLIHGAVEQTMSELDINARRQWFCAFANSRASHMDADQQIAEAGEPFMIGGFEGYYPCDPQLPDEEVCNCACWIEYAVEEAASDESADGNPDAVDSATMPSDQIAASLSPQMFQAVEARCIRSGIRLADLSDKQVTELVAMMTKPYPSRRPATLVSRTWDSARFYGTKAMARRVRTFAPEPIPQPAAPDAQPDHSDGIAVTIVPTVAEKQMLAVPGGLPASEIHCTLAYLGTTAELDDTMRATVSTVITNVCAACVPIEGEVAGVGWFGDQESLTVYLIDGTGLAAFRTALVTALVDAGVPVVTDHDFIPHITASYSRVDEAADRAGMPLHFDEVRCMWGTETYVWDLMGATEVPPEPVLAEPELPPVEPGAPAMTTEPVAAPEPNVILATKITHPDGLNLQARPGHHFVVREGVAVEVVDETFDAAADEMVPVEPDPEVAPAEPQTLADDTLVAELARRAAETAIQEQTDAGVVLTADDVAAIHAAAEEEAGSMFNELVDELAGDMGEAGDGDWETNPEDDGDAIVLGPAEGYAGTLTIPNEITFGNVNGAWAVQPNLETARFQPGHKGQAFAIEGIPAAPAITEYDWEGPITVEGVPSGDMRMFAEGSLDWRQLPVPLAFLDKITREHQEGELAGWIHAIERRADGAIWGFGTYAPTDAATRMQAILADPKGPGRFGISVDVDSVTAVYSTPDGQILDPMEAQEAWFAGEPVMEMMTAGRVAGATCVLHGAFMEAQVWDCGPVVNGPESPVAIAASGARIQSDHWRSISPCTLRTFGQAVAASAGSTDVQAPPSSTWFDLDPAEEAAAPSRGDLGAFRVFHPDDQGRIRVYGVLAPPNECHIGGARDSRGRCQTLPTSTDFSRFYATGQPTDPWAKFYTGQPLSRFYADAKSVICDDGKEVVVGPLILDNVHPNLARQASDAQPFYAHTGSAVGDLRLHMTSRGLVAAGAVRPGVSWIDVYKLRASSTSPDWRPDGNEVKVIAVLAVNVSGFQLQPLAASGGMQYEDLREAVMETVGNVQAIAASAGAARMSDHDRIVALEAELVSYRATINAAARIVERDRAREQKTATLAALHGMGAFDRAEASRVATRDALVAMGVTVPDVPCGCSS